MSPVRPYSLALDAIRRNEGADEVEEQTLTNETTNEQFSVKKEENKEYAGLFTITIERGMTTKKK